MRTKKSLSNISAIFKREMSAYFGSPVAYVFIVIFLILLGIFTFSFAELYEARQADLGRFFYWHPWVFLFLIPAAAMKLWAEEMRMGTIEVILTFPISVGEAILGKFLAAWAFIGICLLLTFPTVITVEYLGDPDLGVIFCAYIGSLLMAGGFLSVGIMTSSLTRSQVISFILAVVICLFFVLAGDQKVILAMSDWAPTWLINIVNNLSFTYHFRSIQKGVLDMRDVIYFLSVIFFMLSANGIVIQNRKTA